MTINAMLGISCALGKGEVDSSILSGSTTQRGEPAEAMVATKLLRVGISVFTPAFGHDHPST
jgi:hypothetical protein